VGGTGIATALEQAGYVLVDKHADVVVVGVDFDLTYAKLKNATLEIRRGAKFVGTNADRTFPGTEGLIPGAGAILAALEAATDIRPFVIGKPEPAMFEMALEKMHADPASTAVLGDRLDTDIEGAQRVGLVSILVLTGVTNRVMLEKSRIRPNLVFENLAELQRTWAEKGPTY
jgi:4-nitrophenyl phosphatase